MEWCPLVGKWQLFLSVMFSEVLPGGIIRCSGVTWWISGLTRWHSYLHAVLRINSIGYFIFGPHAQVLPIYSLIYHDNVDL